MWPYGMEPRALATSGGGPYGFSLASSLTIWSGVRPYRADRTLKGSMGVYGAMSLRCALTKLDAFTAVPLLPLATTGVAASGAAEARTVAIGLRRRALWRRRDDELRCPVAAAPLLLLLLPLVDAPACECRRDDALHECIAEEECR